MNSRRPCNGFVLLPHALTQSLCGGLSFARRLRRQTFCGGTGPLEKATSCECGLKDGVHPLLSQGLEMPDELEPTQCALFLQPHGRTPLRVERIRAAVEIT